MIKGKLTYKSKEEWIEFERKVELKIKRKMKAKRFKNFLFILLIMGFLFFISGNFKEKEKVYLNAKMPLKNSNTIIVENFAVVENGNYEFVLLEGVRK